MRYKAIIIIISISVAFVFMTDGYGFWQKELVIKAHIDVVAPPVEQEVIAKDEIDAAVADKIDSSEITAGTVIEGETLEGVKDTSTEEAENVIVISGSVENTDSKELSK